MEQLSPSDPHLGADPVTDWCRENLGGWVCLDGYQFDERYQRAVTKADGRLMVIDDYVRLSEYHAEIVLDQNFGAEGRVYPAVEGASLLLGPRFALIAPEFASLRQEHRSQPHAARRVLVTLGGSDPAGQTAKVVRALLDVRDPDLEVTAVIGAANPNGAAIAEMLYGQPGFRVVRDAQQMPELMAWADLAVSGTGSTSWELCLMGVPTVSLVLAENQRPAAEALGTAGIFHNLGWYRDLTRAAIASAVAALCGDPERRQEMAARGQRLVDGLGARRVVEVMESRTG